MTEETDVPNCWYCNVKKNSEMIIPIFKSLFFSTQTQKYDLLVVFNSLFINLSHNYVNTLSVLTFQLLSPTITLRLFNPITASQLLFTVITLQLTSMNLTSQLGRIFWRLQLIVGVELLANRLALAPNK